MDVGLQSLNKLQTCMYCVDDEQTNENRKWQKSF